MARINARTGAMTIWLSQSEEEWMVPWKRELCAKGQMKGRMKVFDELWPTGRETRGGSSAGINRVPALRLWEWSEGTWTGEPSRDCGIDVAVSEEWN